MKRFSLLVSLIFWTACGFSQWISPGNGIRYTMADLSADSINAVIVLQNGNYYFPTDLTISTNDTLEIEESVTGIIVNDTVTITIGGVFICAPRTGFLDITGEAIVENNRFDMLFESTAPSTISHLFCSNGNKIFLYESNITFENCEFSNFSSSVISYMNCNPIIRNCYFHDNQAAAISSAVNVTGSPKILNNIFYNNVTANTNTPQINLGPGAVDSIFIIGNHIEGVSSVKSGGIAIADLTNVGNTKARISNNTILRNRYGYTQQGYHISALICDNIIQDNNLEVNAMNGGSGISIYGYTTDCAAKIRRNIISGNLWGITTIYYHNTDMGTVSDPGNNILYANANNGINYALYNNAHSDMTAIGNYWGGNSDTLAESVIFHQTDQQNLGLVTYTPIKTLEPELISFDFRQNENVNLQEDVIGVIDTMLHTVSLYLPSEILTDSLWTPTIVLPLGINCTPTSGTEQFFPEEQTVTYTVSTPHGSSQPWSVTVFYANSVLEYASPSFTIFPNPVCNGQFTIAANSGETMQLALYNILGKCIYRDVLHDTCTTINTKSWSKGIYIVQIKQGNKQLLRKIIVQ